MLVIAENPIQQEQDEIEEFDKKIGLYKPRRSTAAVANNQSPVKADDLFSKHESNDIIVEMNEEYQETFRKN